MIAADNPYMTQINKVQDYIEEHLDETLTMKELCKIADFSEFHFQRIYGLITGENLYAFIKRLRLEKAAHMLLADSKRSIMDIAISNGFANQASFAKAFKLKYGISSSQYRKNKGLTTEEADNYGQMDSSFFDIEPESITVKNEKPMKLVYLRNTGPYKGDDMLFLELFNKLYSWANKRSLIGSSSRWFVLYHDYGEETVEDQLRISVCMSVDRNVALSEGVGILRLEEGKYAVGRFWVKPDEYIKAWHYMYARWFPSSGYKLDDRFSLEHYPNEETKGEYRLVEIYIPII